jgi:hypothetical protein
MTELLRPAEPSPRFRRWFAWWTGRMLRKDFHRLRISHAGGQALAEAAGHDGPLLLVANHAAWWDPLVALRLAEAFWPDRPMSAPIDMAEYERFGVMKKIGLFGIEKSNPAALPAMVQHLQQLSEEHARTAVFITAQGDFTDVRQPIRIRPGAAAVAAGIERMRVLTICLEYVFWQDRRPELLMHAEAVEPPPTVSTAGWHRRLTRGLQQTADALAERAMRRDPAAFTGLPDDMLLNDKRSVNRVYDAWLRWRGSGARIGGGRPA